MTPVFYNIKKIHLATSQQVFNEQSNFIDTICHLTTGISTLMVLFTFRLQPKLLKGEA